MKRHNMRYALAVTAAVLAIIVVQMSLSCVFTCHVGEVFSRTAMSALFFYSVMRMTQRARRTAE